MKKIFAMLLSIWIPIYLVFGLLASCEKSSGSELSISNPATTAKEQTGKNQLVGTWQLKEFFQNIGNGQGKWTIAQDVEQVTFSPEGDFSTNEFFALYDRHFNKYRIVDSTHVELYSTQHSETVTFFFKRESEASLLFNPICRENCTRRYTLTQ